MSKELKNYLMLLIVSSVFYGSKLSAKEACNIIERKTDGRITYIKMPINTKENKIKDSIFFLTQNDKIINDINNFYPLYDQSNNTINWYAVRKEDKEFDLVMAVMHGRLGGEDWYKLNDYSINIKLENNNIYSCSIKKP